jgi:hypothetical protein
VLTVTLLTRSMPCMADHVSNCSQPSTQPRSTLLGLQMMATAGAVPSCTRQTCTMPAGVMFPTCAWPSAAAAAAAAAAAVQPAPRLNPEAQWAAPATKQGVPHWPGATQVLLLQH